jgi:U3 small nucleolar RNA-associated protein MPP10
MAELKVVSNMPSIAIEEVAPVNVADTNVLAPEEIKAKINSLPKSKSEEDKSDRNRKLRTKKLKNKTLKIEKEKRLQLAQALDPENAQISKKLAMNKLEKQSKNMSKNIKILKTVLCFLMN